MIRTIIERMTVDQHRREWHHAPKTRRSNCFLGAGGMGKTVGAIFAMLQDQTLPDFPVSPSWLQEDPADHLGDDGSRWSGQMGWQRRAFRLGRDQKANMTVLAACMLPSGKNACVVATRGYLPVDR